VCCRYQRRRRFTVDAPARGESSGDNSRGDAKDGPKDDGKIDGAAQKQGGS